MHVCDRGKVFSTTDGRCITRAEATSKSNTNDYLQYLQDQWRKARIENFGARDFTVPEHETHGWLKKPGDEGFNAEAAFRMKDLLSAEEDAVVCTVQKKQPYQKTAEWLTNPANSPIESMLMAHRTGAGKTYTMILCLANYFDDPRVKIVLFPNMGVRNNFYEQLMKWDNPFKTYVLQALQKRNQQLSSDGGVFVEQVRTILQELKLRAFTYNEFAGRAAESLRMLSNTGPVACPVLPGGRKNLVCNKIIVMDEAHNLTNPDPDIVKNRFTLINLDHLRESLYYAQNSVKLLFTATPVITTPEDFRRIIRIVKGERFAGKSDEGFISAFYASPVTAYPVVSPPDRLLPTFVEVELAGSPTDKTTSLGNYIDKMFTSAKSGTPKLNPTFLAAKSRDVYEYTAAYFSSQTRAPFINSLRSPEKARIVAPKLFAAAKLAAEAPGKTVILVSKRHGFFSLGYMIEKNPEFASVLGGGKTFSLLGKDVTSARSDFQKQSCNGKSGGNSLVACVKNRFNHPDNGDGSDIKCLVLNADEFSEGIDFKAVRRVVLLDIAASWGRTLQQVGRAVRNCSHAELPPDDRSVETFLLVATLPDFVTLGGKEVDLTATLTVDEQRLVNMIHSRELIENEMCRMINSAVDRETLLPFTGQDHCPLVAEADFFRQAEFRADVNSRKSCDASFSKCKNAALLQGARNQKELQTLYDSCSNKHMSCVADVLTKSDEVDLHSPNCPGALGDEQCKDFCRQYDLDEETDAKCRTRQNVPKRKHEEEEASGEICPNCEGADCASYCAHLGLTGEDKYRCMAKVNKRPCQRTRKKRE